MEEQNNDYDVFTLPSSTLSALASFFDEQSTAQQSLADLRHRRARSYIFGDDIDEGSLSEEDDVIEAEKELPYLQDKYVAPSLKEFKQIFRENWQLSQFWYTEDTIDRLVEAILKLSKPTSRIAFLCCPTAYVAYKEKAPLSQPLRLFEYDTRFAAFATGDFVKYDLDEPLLFSSTLLEELRYSQDIVIVDPPFHAKASQEKLAVTIRHILSPEEGCLLLLTGTSLTPILDDIYQGLPKLVRRDIAVKHDGLETPYGCWIGKSNRSGDESGFGGSSE